MINKRTILLIFFIIILFNCAKGNNNSQVSIDNNYGKKYAKLIDRYMRKDIEKIKDIDSLFQNLTSPPVYNYRPKIKFVFMNKIIIDVKSGLPEYEKSKAPPFSSFSNLIFVYDNGDILFTGVNRNMLQHDVLYRRSSNELIRDESIDLLYRHNNPKRILIDSEWSDLSYNRSTNSYQVGKKIFIDKNNFPEYLFSSGILAPIRSEKSYWVSTLVTKYINNKIGKDYLFFIYDWKSNKVLKNKLLPFLSEYLQFNSGIGGTDSSDRVYLRFWANNERQYKNMTHGHVMIYDIVNDTMYNIRHPFFDEKNEGEEFLETQYILGEDENIYYQLVTDKAYYIYKIEPLWDEPMEETDYNPVFFEFYPELKAEWDKLQEQTD